MTKVTVALIGCVLGIVGTTFYLSLDLNEKNDVILPPDLKTFFGTVVSHDLEKKTIHVDMRGEYIDIPSYNIMRFNYNRDSIFFEGNFITNELGLTRSVNYMRLQNMYSLIGENIFIKRNVSSPTKLIVEIAVITSPSN